MIRTLTVLLAFTLCFCSPQVGAATTFLSIGDTRSDHEDHQAVIDAMIEHAGDAEFYLHSGDMVNDGTSSREWDRWFGIEGPLIVRMPIVPAIGNHDGYRGQDNGFAERFGVHTYHAWASPDLNVFVISVDTHVEINADQSFNDEQTAWLHETLTQCATYPLCIVQAHVGPYGAAVGRSGSQQMRELLVDLEAAGVDLMISGHDHLYERGYTENGIRYLTSAGGGAPIYNPRPDPGAQGNIVEVVEGRHHFLRMDLDVHAGTLRVQAIGTDGIAFDDFLVDLNSENHGSEADNDSRCPAETEYEPDEEPQSL